MKEPRPLSQLLTTFQAALHGERTSIGEVLEAFHERGFGVVLFVFALPMALPLPVPPGVNILLALPLLTLTAQQMVGRHTLWLPRRMKTKTMKTQSLRKMLDKAIPWTIWLENLTRPRLGFMTRGFSSHLVGLAGLIMALSICVPIPLSNTVPSFGIAVMAIGVLMRDGLAVMAGMLIGLTWVACLTAILIFIGVEGVDAFKEAIKSWI